jgi:regulation of enolase protein 1 (concanavalin A-like superfamily)
VRTGDLFTAQWTLDGVTWNTINQRTVSMAATVYFGMALTSHSTTAATAAFDDMRIEQ